MKKNVDYLKKFKDLAICFTLSAVIGACAPNAEQNNIDSDSFELGSLNHLEPTPFKRADEVPSIGLSSKLSISENRLCSRQVNIKLKTVNIDSNPIILKSIRSKKVFKPELLVLGGL